MKIDDMLLSTGEWLKGLGPMSDIVISSRVRLARNLAHHRFPMSASEEEKIEIRRNIQQVIERTKMGKDLSNIDLEALSPLDCRFLVERHLISREHEEAQGARSVAMREDETISVMINEEDHLRLQALKSGLQLEAAWHAIDKFDTELSSFLQFAYDDRLGFLTACPTNVGTGLRASVMLHLPALVMTRHIEKAFRAIVKLNLAVRGLYGEGTEAHGDFYQISNQVTIGRGEDDILTDLRGVIDQVVAYEDSARKKLLEEESVKLQDRIWRSHAILANAHIISSEEVMRHLSNIRLGIHLKILKDIETPILNKMFIFSQPAHLQKLEGKELAADERDIVRASLIRRHMKATA
ncbi:MAG: protein arginine kinase [Planctomycetes bacterium]|nr:protein arginine kinase [Planctomycetota bacterium]